MAIPPVTNLQNPLLQGLGVDLLRRRIHAELDELDNLLTPVNDLHIQSIATWRNSLLGIINQYQNPREIVRQYLNQFENILRNPVAPDAPYPAELFGDRTLPSIRLMVAKMRDPHSVFYSENFDQEATRILAETRRSDQIRSVQQVLLEQLRNMEATRTRLDQEQDNLVNEELAPILNLVREAEAEANEHIARVAREHLQTVREIMPRVERMAQNDQEQRAANQENINRLRKAASEVEAEIQRLNLQLNANRNQLDGLGRETTQLQVQIKQVEAEIAKNKAGWLEQVVCIAASIAISWILKRPVVITPNGAQTF